MDKPRIYATARDVDHIRSLSRSRLITDDERARIDRQLSEGMTPDQASETIAWLGRQIEVRQEPDPCHFCDDADGLITVAIVGDERVATAYGYASVVMRREVQACAECADGREVVEPPKARGE